MCIDDGEVDEHVDCDWACCMLHDEEVRLCNLSCNSRVSGGGWRHGVAVYQWDRVWGNGCGRVG